MKVPDFYRLEPDDLRTGYEKDYGRASEAVSEGADARVAVTTVDIAGAREAIIEAEQRFNECVAAKDWGEACGHAVDGFGAGKIALNAVLAATRAEASSQATTTRDPKPNRAERWIAEPNLEGEGGMIHDTLTGVFVSPTGYGDPWELCKKQAAEFNAKEAEAARNYLSEGGE